MGLSRRFRLNDEARQRITAIVAGVEEDEAPTTPSATELFPLVYDEMRRLARGYMSGENPGHTLQPTALVHEAYLKLVDQTRASWKGRTHFFAVGARVMRRLLVDHARERAAAKRGAGWQRVTLAEDVGPPTGLGPEQLLDLHGALERLAQEDEREARVVVLRCFGGLKIAQVAEVLGVSRRTVEGDWRHARAWLQQELAAE